MKQTFNRLALAVASAGILGIYGCGGGGGSTTSSSATITGTAATGAALANAPVQVTNSAGNSPCVEPSITTSPLGSYTCTLKSGETEPFFIVITDPTGNKTPLVSIATSTPAAGTPLTVNATPLTTAIVAQLNNGDALSLVPSNGSPAAVVIALATLTTNLNTATTNVLAQLKPVLDSIGATGSYNPFTTSITAATAAGTGNTADQVLDIVKISTNPSTGALALSTISDPTPVALASATSTGLTVPAPSFSASDLGAALSTAAAAFNTCFADPVSVRVLSEIIPAPAIANGGPAVDNVSSACQGIVANGNIPSGKPVFKHNGYNPSQFFYALMKDNAMTGAKFSAPEVMAFYKANTTSTNTNEQVDRAILNVRYIDNAGNPGNVITVAAYYTGTATTYSRSTNWWLVGNQQAVDVKISTIIRRTEQRNTGTLTSGAATSGFLSGLGFIISTVGPNSVNYTSAQVTGPGLPTTGLWYFKNSASTQAYMDLSTYRSSGPNAGTYSAGCSSSNCPNYWLGKTTSLTATSYITNPTTALWAQGFATDGSFNGTSGTQPKKGDKYTINLYNGTALWGSVTKTLLTDLIAPSMGQGLPWNSAGTQTLAALDPSNATLNGQLSSLALNWTQNTAAQQMGFASATTTNGGSYSNSMSIARGATSVTITPPSSYLFTSTQSTSNNFRSLFFGYRMLDGSSKHEEYRYN